MTTTLASPEVRGGGSAADELDVDVRGCGAHISEQTSVAVEPIEPRIGFEEDRVSRPQHPLELSQRVPAVALASTELGGIDLEKSNAVSTAQHDRVAVCDPLHGRFVLGHHGLGLRTGSEECHGRHRGGNQRHEWTCHGTHDRNPP